MLNSPRLVTRLYPLTAAAAAGAALVATIMLLRGHSDGWQVFAILLIATLLGETLAPILERYSATEERPKTRVLGEVGDVEVIAVRRGGPRLVKVGDTSIQLASDESIVVRVRP
jgi:membrane protein implicated in regulation of membrane protease activity